MPENIQREPDNTVTMDVGGTKYVIHEFLCGKESINDIIAKRIMSDLAPSNSTKSSAEMQ